MGYRWCAELFLGQYVILFVTFSCMAFFGTAFVNSLNWALVPDTVDYGEWKTGIRAEASGVYGLYPFAKFPLRSRASCQASSDANRLFQHNPERCQSLLGLRQLIFLWPCGLAIIAAFTMGLFYKLNETRFAFIIEEISQRKKTTLKRIRLPLKIIPLL